MEVNMLAAIEYTLNARYNNTHRNLNTAPPTYWAEAILTTKEQAALSRFKACYKLFTSHWYTSMVFPPWYSVIAVVVDRSVKAHVR